MGRLIDADELLAQIRQIDFLKTPNSTKLSACEIMEIVNRQPTAYDVETVVAELEDAKFLMPPENDNHYADNGLFLEDAIDIVKRGGVE